MDIYLLMLFFVILYLFILLFIKLLKIGKKIKIQRFHISCPKCKSELKRIKKKTSDKFMNIISLQYFRFRRYQCSNKKCNWEGIRW